MYDRTAKADTYAALGVAELWLVSLEHRVIEQRVLDGTAWTVRGPFSGAQIVASHAFAGLEATADEVFA